ncbi:MAG: SCP2 sterol-binding domain-containing protein [Gammaproteobacteria bacterium]|nr:SCP2 sterol-binding domain-containing protein [Gammaproteobacteria bacterium]
MGANPSWLEGSPLLGAVEIAVNRVVKDHPEAAEKLASLEGRSLQLDIRNAGIGMRMYVASGAIEVSLPPQPATQQNRPDARIEAGVGDLMRMAAGQSDAVSMIASDLRIEGNTDVAQQFQKLLQEAPIDWEGQLAKVVGDVPAYEISQIGKRLFGLAQHAAKSFFSDGTEYLRDESQDLAWPHEVKEFRENVETLRDDVARLEARIFQLKAKRA